MTPGTDPVPAVSARRALARLRGERPDEHARILLRRRARSPARILATRGAALMALFALVILVMYADRAGLHDNADGTVSFTDVVYFTMVTVTTVGYGDIVPVGDRARLLDALFLTPVRLFVWFLFVGTAYELLLQRLLEDWRMKRLQRNLADHVILCGFGASGETAARQLLGRGAIATGIVVIDVDPVRAREAADRGYVALHGDATREDLLRVAGIERARAVVISVARDDTTALVILTIRGLGSRARVVATVRATENARLLRTSGADELISPWELGGCMLANAVSDDSSARVVQDMVSAGGRIQLAEREVRATELGRTPGELRDCLVVQVRRDGQSLMFWEVAERPLERGDILVTVEKPVGVMASRPAPAAPASPE